MKVIFAGLFLFVCGQALTDVQPGSDYPSCIIQAQHNGSSKTRRSEALLSERINVLQADISTARKSRKLTQVQADTLWQKAKNIHNEIQHYVSQQGFLSAGERLHMKESSAH